MGVNSCFWTPRIAFRTEFPVKFSFIKSGIAVKRSRTFVIPVLGPNRHVPRHIGRSIKKTENQVYNLPRNYEQVSVLIYGLFEL